MPSVSDQHSGRAFWRSLDDLAGTPEFRDMVAREFPSFLEDVITPATRRGFLKLMGASLALGGIGLAGCRRWPEEEIAPFANRPEGRIPGIPDYYATAFEINGVAEGIVATAYDGRPIKVDGNNIHPMNRSASSPFAQASILELYDPERSRVVVRQGSRSSWKDFASFARSHFGGSRSRGGRGLAVLTERSSSLTFNDMKQRFMSAFPNAGWYEYDPVNDDNARAGSTLVFGSPKRTHNAFDRAAVVVDLDSDFMGSHPAWIKHAREFMAARRPDDGRMNRLYTVESALSITGATADHRLGMKATNVPAIAAAIAKRLVEHGVTVDGLSDVASTDSIPQHVASFIDAIVTDLVHAREAGEHSIVVTGERQPPEVHALAHLLNQALGNVGETVSLSSEPEGESAAAQIRSLTEAMNADDVDTLVILGGNPVYNAPADVQFAEALGNVASTVHLSNYIDETSDRCAWHVNRAHYLESWSDARGWNGTASIVQPLIQPLYNGKTPAELLAHVIGDDVTAGYDLVRRTYQGRFGAATTAAFERAWRRALHDGVVEGTAFDIDTAAAAQAGDWIARLNELASSWKTATGRVTEIVFVQDAKVFDGRFANNGWLQELPDPVTKLTWDNAAVMSPATAEALGVGGQDTVNISANGQPALMMAAHVSPGQPDGTISVALGYGRRRAGHIGDGVGFNTYQIRTTGGMSIASDVNVTRADGSYTLAVTQDHHIMQTDQTEYGKGGKQERVRNLVLDGRWDRFRNEGSDAFYPPGEHPHHPRNVSLWEEVKYTGDYKWAMSIDLTSCIGCNSCVVACQAENNVPIVGKDQVLRGREMHWIRLDRYYKFRKNEAGEWVPNDVEKTAFQPVTCMHCETAPCEQVCPVAATTHDKDGLNVMVYNRCVGTRYCSNNCPYKVRRFNFYDWHARSPRDEGLGKPYLMMPDQRADETLGGDNQVRKMLFNPEVTVRSVGVMEKCSYCIQRINRAKVDAKNEWMKLSDDEKRANPRPKIEEGAVTPACAQACPTKVIVFGDLNDPNSHVSRLRKNTRTYSLLDYLNTQPRTKYLGRIRNPNGQLEPVAQAAAHGRGKEPGEETH